MKKSPSLSLNYVSSLSGDTSGLGSTFGESATLSNDSGSNKIESTSTNTTKLMDLINSDKCQCVSVPLIGEDASLESDHGLLDVQDEEYWFDEDTDPSCDDYGSTDSETSTKIADDGCSESEASTKKNDASARVETMSRSKNEASTTISDGLEMVSQDSEDSLINGIITVNLQPKLSKQVRDFIPTKSSTQRVENELDLRKYEDVETHCKPLGQEKGLHQIGPIHPSVITSCSSETTNVIQRAKDSLDVSIPHDNHELQYNNEGDNMHDVRSFTIERHNTTASTSTNDLIDMAKAINKTTCCDNDDLDADDKMTEKPITTFSLETTKVTESAKSILKVTIPRDDLHLFTKEADAVNDEGTYDCKTKDSEVIHSHHQPKRGQYISPRIQLAHKCLQNALKIIQHEDATNSSMNSTTTLSREDLYSLTNTGYVMMLKKKEQKDDDNGRGNNHKDGDCKIVTDLAIEMSDDEQRDDEPTICKHDDEQREAVDVEAGTINSGNDAPTLVSYIGTVAEGSINSSPSLESLTNVQSADPPTIGGTDSHDSQYLQVVDSQNSPTGLSHIGTAVMEGTPHRKLTACYSEDRIDDVPSYDACCWEKKQSEKESNTDLVQVETTPTDDETISLEVATVTSVKSSTSSHGSKYEAGDTLSPLPPTKFLSHSCSSPVPSFGYSASIAESSASTSVSDVFGMLRTSLKPVDTVSNSSSEGNEEMFNDSNASLLKQNILPHRPTTEACHTKKRSKSMNSIGLTLGRALMATDIFTPPKTQTKTLASYTPSSAGAAYSKRSDKSEWNYGSIGATFSPLRTLQPSRPDSVVFGAVTSPSPSMFSGYTDTNTCVLDEATSKRTTSGPPVTKEERTVLAIAEKMDGDSSSDAGSEVSNGLGKENSLNNQPSDKARELESGGAKKTSCLQEYLMNSKCESYPLRILQPSRPVAKSGDVESSCEFTVSAKSEEAELRDRVKWLEKVLGIGTGGANRAFENEISDLKRKLYIVEQRLEEEMELKAAAKKTAQSLQSKLKGLNEQSVLADNHCLQSEVTRLQSQLECEKIKTEQAESDVKAALSSVLDLGIVCEKKDEEIAELMKANQQSLNRQADLERELLTCAKGNDELRFQLASLASAGSTKEHTLTSALNQLKSLSENFYHTQKQLEVEKTARRNEVEALQYSLDDCSRQMLILSGKVHTLEADNDSLRINIKRLVMEKEQNKKMKRSARGF